MINTENQKEFQRNNWSSAAEGWQRRDALLQKGAAPVTKRMLELAQIESGSVLLDIASGTGQPALSAAKIVGANGKVIGTDLVDEMLVVARKKAEQDNLKNIIFYCNDGEKLDYPDASFDAVTIRWGLMFMPEPQACLDAAYKALNQGGCISLACWSAPEQNPFVSLLMQTLGKYMEIPEAAKDAPGIFAFSDESRLYNVMEKVGFRNIGIEEMALDVLEVDNGRAYWDAISDLAAPVMALVDQLEDSARSDYIEEVIETADALKQGDSLRMRGVTWIASGEK